MDILEKLFYWSIVGVLGFLNLLQLVPTSIPIYVTGIFVLLILFFLFNKIILQLTALGLKVHISLFTLQFLVTFISLINKSPWIALSTFLLYLSIEGLQIVGSQKIYHLNQSFKQMEEERNQFNEMFRIVRSERHDFLKHISVLHYMLENERTHEAHQYLNELVDDYKETNLSIKGERGVVAGILHHMYNRATSLNMDIVYDFDIPLSSLPLTNKEIVTLIGNILSNSIDACEEWQKVNSEKASISFQFNKRGGLYILVCKNSTVTIPTEIIDHLFHSFGKTTKSGDHEGLGTKLIFDIVKKYHGFLDYTHKDESFQLKIKIPAIR